MNYLIRYILPIGLLVFATSFQSFAQQQSDVTNRVNTVNTAVPFLRINPDARSGAMGNAGIAISPDANANYHNPSKLAFTEKDVGLSVTYTPWLRSLVGDIYLAYMAGHFRIDELQSIGLSMRYFSLGDIKFTDRNGENIGQSNPNEFALDASYSRKLSDHFSTGLTLRFIYSNLAAGQEVSGVQIEPATAASADISFYYTKDFDIDDKASNFSAGLNVSNLGNKVTYTESAVKDFLPANIGIGTNFTINVDDYNKLSFAFDANKLLAPTPDSVDNDQNGVLDYREESVPSGVLGSFGDAPGGFSEELREVNLSFGAEYWYNDQFAIRAGYFWEHETKGARQFFSAGLGVKYSVFGLDFSYLIPTSNQRNPLDNTLRFSLKFDFSAFQSQNNNNDSQSGSEGVSN